MFLSQQAAFITAGRWLLPTFKKAGNLQYDVVSWPTNTGNKIEPAPIPTAYIALNAKASNPDAGFAFLTDFVSKEGQIFRLKGGGNAVPSIKGADEVVSEGNLPPNWQAFLDSREVGYATWPAQAATAGLDDEINKTLDAVWLKGGDIDATFAKIAEIVKQKKGAA
jgi:multiple sugar transport system substrate-binding protein